jgi:hypothetical protein
MDTTANTIKISQQDSIDQYLADKRTSSTTTNTVEKSRKDIINSYITNKVAHAIIKAQQSIPEQTRKVFAQFESVAAIPRDVATFINVKDEISDDDLKILCKVYGREIVYYTSINVGYRYKCHRTRVGEIEAAKKEYLDRIEEEKKEYLDRIETAKKEYLDKVKALQKEIDFMDIILKKIDNHSTEMTSEEINNLIKETEREQASTSTC